MTHRDRKRPEKPHGDVVRHEEELDVSTEPIELGSVVASKRVQRRSVTDHVPVELERADVERVEAAAGDSGEIETLADGSISIPVFEEELVVTKRLVVRERVIIRKRQVTEHRRIEAELRRERVDIEGAVDPASGDAA